MSASYFNENNMIDFVIHSYNQLLDNLKNIIQKYEFKYELNKNLTVSIDIKDVTYEPFDEKIMTYIQAVRQREKNFSTRAKITADIVFNEGAKRVPVESFFIEFPIMTNCYLDPVINMSPEERYLSGNDTCQLGGDIVFAGVPYLVQNTLQYPLNKPIYAPSDQPPCVVFANYLYQADVMFGNSYYTRYDLNIKATGAASSGSLGKDGKYSIVMHFKQQNPLTKIGDVPIFMLFKYFGCKTDKEILDICNPQNDHELEYFLINMERTRENTKETVFDLICSKQANEKDLDGIIERYITNNPQAYIYTLGEIVRGLYYAYKTNTFTNRDALQNKRIFTISSQMLSQIRGAIRTGFMQSMYVMSKNISSLNQVDSKKPNIIKILDSMSKTISKTLVNSFVNSNYGTVAPLQKTLNEQKTAVLDIMQKRQIAIRTSFTSGESNKRQRMMQKDWYGFVCPISTPESGASTGKYNSPTIYSYVTIAKDPTEIIDYITHHKLYSKTWKKYTMPIKVNYNCIGFVAWDKFKTLYEDLMKWRQSHSLLKEPLWQQKYDLPFYKRNTITSRQDYLMTSIYYSIERQELCINTDAGRIMTPIVKSKTTSIERAIKLGSLIYIDCDMIQNFIVSENEVAGKWHFLKGGLLGDFPNTSPFCGTLKAIRALYSTAQMKQNISLPYTNPNIQTTNQQLIINHPQIPIIDTSYSRELYETKPSMQLVFIVFKAATYNQEDAMVVNGGYFARNGGSSSSYKTYTTQLQEGEKFEPIKLKIGQNIRKGDVLITKVNETTQTRFEVKYQEPYITKFTQISNIIQTENEVLIQVNLSRYPVEGDKFVSRNAQKSTVGKIYKEYEMPILSNGIVPTFIQNPDSVLRRETYGQMIEPAIGRYLAESCELIANYGHGEYDQELLIKASKQSQYDDILFGGPMMYAAQKHLVAQKIYAVNNAAVAKSTRQPAAGRRRHGGIRLGNMEQSALYAQGCAKIIKDMNGANSSNVQWYVCKRCGTNQVYKKHYVDDGLQEFEYHCNYCGPTNDVEIKGFSYQQQLLQEVFNSIGLQLIFKNYK